MLYRFFLDSGRASPVSGGSRKTALQFRYRVAPEHLLVCTMELCGQQEIGHSFLLFSGLKCEDTWSILTGLFQAEPFKAIEDTGKNYHDRCPTFA